MRSSRGSHRSERPRQLVGGLAILGAAVALACAPRVKLEAPDEPIVIHIKIEHELRVKLDRELEQLFEENEDLFGEAA